MIARWLAGALFAGILFVSASPSQAQTVEEYLQIERGESKIRPEFNIPLLAGVLEGLAAFSDTALINGIRFFCVGSATAQVKFEEFKKRVDRMLYNLERERDDFERYAQQTSIGTIGLKVLIEAYPCTTDP